MLSFRCKVCWKKHDTIQMQMKCCLDSTHYSINKGSNDMTSHITRQVTSSNPHKASQCSSSSYFPCPYVVIGALSCFCFCLSKDISHCQLWNHRCLQWHISQIASFEIQTSGNVVDEWKSWLNCSSTHSVSVRGWLDVQCVVLRNYSKEMALKSKIKLHL